MVCLHYDFVKEGDMGSKEGTIKVAAKRLGIEYREYLAHIASGEKHCTKCKQWKAISDFPIDRTRGDGYAARCHECHRTGTKEISKRQRSQMKAQGLAWCRGCRKWMPFDGVIEKQGACRDCVNRERRESYATNDEFRHKLKNFAYQRKRQVDAVPLEGEETLTMLFDGKCAYCSAPATTWDHIVPVSKGGKTTPGNMLPACLSCNSSKGDQDIHDWILKVGIEPGETLLDRLAFAFVGLYG